MKKIRMITCLLTAALITAALAGCGETSAKTVDVTNQQGQEQQGQGQQEPQKERGTMAKVVSLEGDQLTVILADMPDGRRSGTPPAIDAPQDSGTAPADGQTPPDGAAAPNGGNGPASASGPAIDGSGAPAGGPGQPDQGGGEIRFTGEQATYTLSSDVAIIKGTGEDAAEIDLSELAADNVIRFTTITDNGNEVINSIVVID